MNLLSLSQYAKHKDGTYVSMDLSQESKDILDHFVEMSLGLTERVDPSTYHVTLCYSRTPVPAAEQFAGVTCSEPAFVAGYSVFPTKTDGECLVLRLDYPFAYSMDKTLTKLGATSEYSEYKPHLTLAYDMKEKIDPETLPIPRFELYFDKVKVVPLDPKTVPANKS